MDDYINPRSFSLETLTFITVLAFPSRKALFFTIFLTEIMSKSVITSTTECCTIIGMVIKIASDMEFNGYDSAIVGVKCAKLPI